MLVRLREIKRKRKSMNAGSPSNEPFLTPPCPQRPKNQIFTIENSHFLQQELLDDFLRVLASARTTEDEKE